MAERTSRGNFSCKMQRRAAAFISEANLKAAYRVGE
jgi:hypothetical protein